MFCPKLREDIDSRISRRETNPILERGAAPTCVRLEDVISQIEKRQFATTHSPEEFFCVREKSI